MAWSIGQVAKRAGIAASAIRYYESVGLLPVAERVSGRRVYDDDVFQRLALIDLAQRAGFTVKEIRTLLHGFARRTPPGVRWRKLAGRKLDEVEVRIEEAQAMKRVLGALLACECPSFEACALPTVESRVD
ncbi:MAG: MerR family transcriptional regulator [Myxococcota bacterium]